MLKLNRTTEYGLMAISYIRSKNAGELTSAREIADHFSLPFEILAKTLQKLKDQGVIASTYGTRGGYVLARDLKALNLTDFLKMMEGPVSVVSCATHHVDTDVNCEYSGKCGIKPVMSTLHERVYDFLSRISVEELTRSSSVRFEPLESPPISAVQGEEP